MSKRALVFPGQGSQVVGMGGELVAAFASARQVWEEVDDALGESLSKLVAEGPIETLTLTENAQPALLATSIVVMRVLEREGGFDLASQAAFVAGHSLGEYSALTAAGALTLRDAVRLVRVRGLAMQKAVPVGTGAMAALLGAELEIGEKRARSVLPPMTMGAANSFFPVTRWRWKKRSRSQRKKVSSARSCCR